MLSLGGLFDTVHVAIQLSMWLNGKCRSVDAGYLSHRHCDTSYTPPVHSLPDDVTAENILREGCRSDGSLSNITGFLLLSGTDCKRAWMAHNSSSSYQGLFLAIGLFPEIRCIPTYISSDIR